MKDEIIKKITTLLQAISNEHGVQVESFRVDWLDVSSVGKRKYLVERVKVEAGAKWPLN